MITFDTHSGNKICIFVSYCDAIDKISIMKFKDTFCKYNI